MIPTKVKTLIPEVAQGLGIPKDDLDTIVSFYFKETRKQLSNLEHLHFVIPGLGRMTIKGWNIQKEIDRREKTLTKITDKDDIKKLNAQIEIFKGVLVKWEDQESKKKETKLKKQQYYKDKENKELGKPITDDTKGEDTISLAQ